MRNMLKFQNLIEETILRAMGMRKFNELLVMKQII